jgi:F420H(2)-dependent quinone reductase
MQLLARAILWLHVSLYRLTNGRIGGRFIAGSPILLLTTTGRRTGKRRTRPLAYVRDGERYVRLQRQLAGPSWLVPQPKSDGRAEIQVGPQHLSVTARTADPAERRRLFPWFVEVYQGYGVYEDKTTRQIPLGLLTPDAPNSTA